MKTEITNKNSKGQLHGYQEGYYSSGELAYRRKYKNGLKIGYVEWHLKSIKQTHFHVR